MDMGNRSKPISSTSCLEHDPEKHGLGLDPMGGNRLSDKTMLKNEI
jgi:hypothetical protein